MPWRTLKGKILYLTGSSKFCKSEIVGLFSFYQLSPPEGGKKKSKRILFSSSILLFYTVPQLPFFGVKRP